MIDTNTIDKYLIMNEDCMEAMKRIPDGSIDLILCDPPYNLAKYSTGNMKFDWRSEINNDVAAWDLKELTPSDFLEEFKRILSPTGNIFVFTSYNLIGKWHEVFDSEFDTFQFMVWHKTNPIPNIRKSSFLNSCELIVCMWNKGHIWNFKKQNEMHNFFESPICMGSERLKDPKHPTQKPLKILKHIIEIASAENSVVLDMFMGVGSTGVAARELNRRFIGIEIDETYFNAAKKRIEAAVPDPTLSLTSDQTNTTDSIDTSSKTGSISQTSSSDPVSDFSHASNDTEITLQEVEQKSDEKPKKKKKTTKK